MKTATENMKYLYFNYHIPEKWGWGHHFILEVSEQTETHIIGKLDWSSTLWDSPLAELIGKMVSVPISEFIEKHSESGIDYKWGRIDESLIKESN